MTKRELLDRLWECIKNEDTESAHGDADDALLDYIDDKEIREAFDMVEKWYS